MPPSPPRPQCSRAAAVLGVLLASALLAFPAGAAAARSCHGRRATIVSNARTIVGTKAPDVIVAGGGASAIYGEGGNDLICAGGGADVVRGGRGKDRIYGEGGDDAIYGERGSDSLDGGAGADALFGEHGNDKLGGGGGSDRLNGGPGDDSLDGGPGDFDLLVGGPGNDRIDGGPGAHDVASYAGTGGAVTIDLATQTVRGAEAERLKGVEDAIGGSAGDTLIGDPATPNRLDGGPGEDQLVPAGPSDEAFGGPGSDQCGAGFVAETSCGASQGVGGTSVEVYESIDGFTSLIISGGEGRDAARVGFAAGAYVVQGEPQGAPVRLGDPTSAVCAEAAVLDRVTCRAPIDSILASLGGGDDSFAVAPSVPARVSSIIEGGPGDDVIRGGAGADVLYGVNVFHPRKDSGATRMLGGPGSDLMVGGQPCDGDLFDGGPGANDSASFARVRNSGTYVVAKIGGPVLDPNVHGCHAGRITRSVEKIEGSPGHDVLVGDGAANVLLGRGGSDRLDGRGGADTCIGGGGHDRARSCESTASVP